jgi:N4-gp56 family major capsid protein
MVTAYGDISPRTAAYAVKELLKRGMPYLVFEKFGQSKPLPKNNSKTIKFRRYWLDATGFTDPSDDDAFNAGDYFASAHYAFDPSQRTLTEGVTPNATAINKHDISATLVQYGDRIEVSDVVQDTHEDPVLNEGIEMLGEQAAIILEGARFNVLKAGSNVVYSNGSARSDVKEILAIEDIRLAERTLERQLAKPITKMVRSTANYGTEALSPCFVGVCHTDLRYNIEKLTGFVHPKDYGTVSPWENEIGSVGKVRFVSSTLVAPWTGVGTCGATGGTNVIENGSSQAHVYPILIFARDAYGIVPLKGKAAIVPMVVNAKPSDSDPLAQRNHASWKAMQTTVILNDAFMVRIECAVTANGYLT